MAIAGDVEVETAATITKRALTFAGFMGVGPHVGEARVFSGKRPAWEVGASAPLRLSSRKVATALPVANGANGSEGDGQTSLPAQSSKATWKISLEDDDGFGGGGDDDLVDEDALLDASAPVKRATEKVGGEVRERWVNGWKRGWREEQTRGSDSFIVGFLGTGYFFLRSPEVLPPGYARASFPSECTFRILCVWCVPSRTRGTARSGDVPAKTALAGGLSWKREAFLPRR